MFGRESTRAHTHEDEYYEMLDNAKNPQLNIAQYSTQLIFRTVDALSVGYTFATLTVNSVTNWLGTPPTFVATGLKTGSVALIDVISEDINKPMLTVEKPYEDNTPIGGTWQFFGTAIAIGAGCSVGVWAVPPIKNLLGEAAMDVILNNRYSSLAILGASGGILKALFVSLPMMCSDKSLLAADLKDDPKKLHALQRVGQYAFRYIKDVAWVETIRDLVLYSGKDAVAQNKYFKLLILAADISRRFLQHVSYVPHPFYSLVDKELIESKSLEAGTGPRRQYISIQDSRKRFRLPTKWEVMNASGTKVAETACSAAITASAYLLFAKTDFAEQYNQKEKEEGYSALGFRMLRDLALFSAYVGMPLLVVGTKNAGSYCKNRYSQWQETRRAAAEARAKEEIIWKDFQEFDESTKQLI